MGRRSRNGYPKKLRELMAEKTKALSQAQAFSSMKLAETAKPLWATVAAYEERIAPLLEALGREAEAAVHRASGGTCYEKITDWGRAANLYRAALSGPMSDASRREVENLLARCLGKLIPRSRNTA